MYNSQTLTGGLLFMKRSQGTMPLDLCLCYEYILLCVYTLALNSFGTKKHKVLLSLVSRSDS